MKQLGRFLSLVTWLLVVGSMVIITGSLMGRPLLLAAVPTGSMVPILRPGDMIVVLPTWLGNTPGLGDIVVYKTEKNSEWIVHRIVDGNSAEGFVTKGDANYTADPDRVFPRHIAGVVPQWRGQALRLPRLGLLSLENGPVSSPVVAGVALVMGVYLLVMDARPRVKLPKLQRLRGTKHKPDAVLGLYVGLGAAVFLTTLVPAWTLSSSHRFQYEVVSQLPEGYQVAGTYIQGRGHHEEATVENPSPLPLVVVFHVDDPHVRYDPRWTMLAPHTSKRVSFTVDNTELGKHQVVQEMGVFLPLLPPAILAGLVQIGMALAVVAVAMVPTTAVLVIAAFDERTRVAFGRFRARLIAKLSV